MLICSLCIGFTIHDEIVPVIKGFDIPLKKQKTRRNIATDLDGVGTYLAQILIWALSPLILHTAFEVDIFDTSPVWCCPVYLSVADGITIQAGAYPNPERSLASQLNQFQNQAYLNLETFRKNGIGVKSPAWFAQNGERLYVRIGANSWKVKRVGNNPQVKIVPCNAQGQPMGEWLPGQAQRITDLTRAKEINQLLNKKYGFQKRAFDLMGKLRKDEMGVLEIKLNGD